MTLIPDVYLQARDGQTYAPKLLDPGTVLDVSWDYQEQGGLAQIAATLAVRWEDSGVAPGDYLEAWVLGEAVPRARGIVSTPERRLDLKETRTLLAFGRMADMDKVLEYKTIFHPSGSPQDLSYYAAELLSDYQKRKAVGSAVAPPLDIDIQTAASNLESLTLAPGSVRAGFDQLYAQAGGNAVWGWDIHPVTGNDRCYLRPRTSAVGAQVFVGDNVRLLTAPAELTPLTNAVFFRGGPAKYPNLLTNASFEQPTNPTANSGSLLVNGSFELGNPNHSASAGGESDALGWSLSGGATRNQHDPGSSHNASAHTGGWYLLLDHAGESASQDVPVTVPAGGLTLIAALYAACENAQHPPAGTLTVTGRDAQGNLTETPAGGALALAPPSVAWTGGAASAVVGSDALQTALTLTNPATVRARVTLTCTQCQGPGFGLCLDDVTLGPLGAVGQYGWSTHLQNPGSAANAINYAVWACKAAAWDGAYGVRLSVTADPSNKPALAPAGGDDSGASQFHFRPQPQQSLLCAFMVRMASGLNGGPGSVTAEYREWAGDGHQTQFAAVTRSVPNDGLWHLVCVPVSAHGDAASATAQLTFGASGVYDVDGASVRDAAAPLAEAQDPQAAGYLRGSDFERYVTAEAVCTSGSGADVAAAASYSAWGRREAALTNDQVTDWTPDAAAYLQAWFQRNAVLLQRPKVELIGETRRVILPGDGGQVAVSGTGSDLAPQWCSHAAYKFARARLDVSLDLSNERPTWAKMLKAAQAGGGSAGSSVGAPAGGGQTGATTPAMAPVQSVNTRIGAVVLGAGDVGAEPALGLPGADGLVLTSTRAGVRSWTQPGAGFAAAPPVVPTGISQQLSYNGVMMNVEAVPALYGADPAPSVPYTYWQISTDGGQTWAGNDGTANTTYPGPVLQRTLTSGTIRLRVRTENASGVASAWYAQSADTAYAPPTPYLQKRRVSVSFYPPSTAADAGPNTTQPFRLPSGTGGAGTTWKPSGPATLHTKNGTATATTFQLYFDTAAADFAGGGTAVLAAPLSVSGTGTQEAATTAFGSAALAGIPGGCEVCPRWAAQAVAGTYAVCQFEEV